MGVQIDGVGASGMNTVLELEDKCSISAIPVDLLHAVWDRVAPILQRACDVSHGDITLTSTRNRLVAGSLQLYTISRGQQIVAVFCTDVQTAESGLRSLRVPIIAGDDLEEWIDDAIEAWRRLGKELMCDVVRGIGRPGWERKLRSRGLRKTHVAYDLEIEP